MSNKLPRQSVICRAEFAFGDWTRELIERYPENDLSYREWSDPDYRSFDYKISDGFSFNMDPEVAFVKFMGFIGHQIKDACALWIKTIGNMAESALRVRGYPPANPGYTLEAYFIRESYRLRARVLSQIAMYSEFPIGLKDDRCKALMDAFVVEGEQMRAEGKRLHDEHIRQYEHDHRNRWQRLKDWWNARQVPEPSPPTP